jgi:hypothetical protein
MVITLGLCAEGKFTYGLVKRFKGGRTCVMHVLGAHRLKHLLR